MGGGGASGSDGPPQESPEAMKDADADIGGFGVGSDLTLHGNVKVARQNNDSFLGN